MVNVRRNALLAAHLVSLACLKTILEAGIVPKKHWVHPVWTKRREHGAYHYLVKSLATTDADLFKKYLRMTPAEFKKLKDCVRPYIKKNPRGRRALSVGHRLAMTIRFLASGEEMTSISWSFLVGFSTACEVIHETCEAIYSALKDDYLKVPNAEGWKEIEAKYCNTWQFPNCIGAVDGKHVRIKAPAKSGSNFYNYKGYFSMVLLAVVDAEYKFTVVDVGGYGSSSDGGLWKNSEFGSRFDSGEIDLPDDKNLPGTVNILPHVLVGDEAFQLRERFMRPYPAKKLTESKRIFNYRLSRARRCSENAFGILTARWRIFHRCINMKPKYVDKAIRACVALHNFLLTEKNNTNESRYCPNGFADEIGSTGEVTMGRWRDQSNPANSLTTVEATAMKNYTNEAFEIRETFCKFFNTVGSVEWQQEAAGINEIYKN